MSPKKPMFSNEPSSLHYNTGLKVRDWLPDVDHTYNIIIHTPAHAHIIVHVQ